MVQDMRKTKAQLVSELEQLRQRVAQLEAVGPGDTLEPSRQSLVEEIARRELAESALRHSEKKYRALFEQEVDSTLLVNVDTGKLVEFNQRAHENLGYTREEFQRLSIADFEAIETIEAIQEHIKKVLKCGEDTFETKHRRKDGEIRDVLVSCRSISIDGTNLVMSVCRDITESKRAEEALVQERQFVHALMEAIPDPIYAKDTEGRYTRVNRAEVDVRGLTDPSQALGKTDFDLFVKEKAAEWFADEQEIMRTGQPLVGKEDNEIWLDGRITWVSGTKAPLRDDEGNIVGIIGISRDITDRKQAELALAEERNLLLTLIDAVPDYIYVKDIQGRFVMANTAQCALVGATTRKELVGKTDFDFFPKELASEYKADEQRIVQSGQPMISKEERTVDTAGTGQFVLTTKAPLFNDQGKCTGIVGMSRDVTERKRVEERLHFLSSCIEQTREGIAIADTEGRLLFSNEAFAAMHGRTPEEVEGKHLSIFHTPEQMPAVDAANKQVLETGEFSGEIWHVRRDGSVFPSLMHSTRMISEAGDTIGIIGTLRDISELKRTEHALMEERNLLRTFFDTIPDDVFAKDTECRLTVSNMAHVKALGASCTEQVIGKTDFDFYPREVAEKFCADDMNVIRTGEAMLNYEESFVDQQGQTRCGLVSKMPLRDSSGRVIGLVGTCHDITELKRTHEHVRTLTRELLKAQETERRRIALDLHDQVAQDLAAMNAICGMLLDGELEISDEVRNRIAKFFTTLKKAIDTVRELAHGLQPAELALVGLAKTIHNHCQGVSNDEGLDVDFISAGMESLDLDFDTQISLYRVAQEAIRNIVHHADAHHAVVKLVASGPSILLRIEDDGKGFDVEERRAAALGEKHVGLSNMEERVKLLNGTMHIRSKPKRGTSIVIEIPHAAQSARRG